MLILLGVTLDHLLPALSRCRPIRCARSPAAARRRETVENIRHQLGLDQPFVIAILALSRPASLQRRSRPLLPPEDRGRRADRRRGCRRRLLLMVGAIFCELAIGLTMGLLAAVRRGSRHRPGADGRLLRRRLGAAIRRRPPAALRLRRAARLVPDRRLRHAGAISCCRR